MTKIEKKLNEIHADLEQHVTRIYERRDLLMAYDLAWHSVLQFEFNGQMLTRGWVEVLVVGDTRCGKTKTAERLLKHYRAGEMGTGENTSIAGLIGGMQQLNRHWSITWGKFPRNDRRLVVVDEASNISVQHIPEFATLRSEGVARITKIQSEQTYSRTRALWISNPRPDRDGISRPISGYDYGVSAIPELIGRQADVARFDVGIVVANGEVSESVILGTRQTGAGGEPRFSSDVCNSLVLWAWSRGPADVKILDETTQEIMHRAKRMAVKYHDSIPLVKLEEFPEKLARLSVALAARLFSTRDGSDVVVLPDHVAHVADFLDHLYSKPTMGYDQYSKRLMQSESIEDADKVTERVSEYGPAFVRGLLAYDIIRQHVLEDLAGADRDGGRALASFLIRNRCLKSEHSWYRKTTPFIKLLKRLDTEGVKQKREEF